MLSVWRQRCLRIWPSLRCSGSPAPGRLELRMLYFPGQAGCDLLTTLDDVTPKLTGCDGRFHVGGIDLLVEIGVQPVVIEFALPPRHEHRGDAIADDVGERADLAHELVHRKHDRHAR